MIAIENHQESLGMTGKYFIVISHLIKYSMTLSIVFPVIYSRGSISSGIVKKNPEHAIVLVASFCLIMILQLLTNILKTMIV